MIDFHGKALPLSASGFRHVLESLGADAHTLWALLTVETCGFGFLPDRRPKILFERHIFCKRTQGRHDAGHPSISSRITGGYRGGAAEYERLRQAMRLDRRAAVESVSWGLGQIMGFNAVALGYRNADDMAARFCEDEDAQLQGVLRFIRSNPALDAALRRKDWKKVAFFYNGAAYARNAYDRKLALYHELYRIKGTPSIDIRTAQAYLTYLGFDPRGVDGLIGDGTRTALIAFQKSQGLQVSAELDDQTMERLAAAAVG
jgi:hypothetical protein